MCVSIFIADIINTQMLTNKRQDKMFHYSCKLLTVEKKKFEQKRIDIHISLAVCCVHMMYGLVFLREELCVY